MLESITFDTTGLSAPPDVDGRREWTAAEGAVVKLHYFPIPPDIPVGLDELAELRRAYRTNYVNNGCGLVELDVIGVAGLRGIRHIMKAPQAPYGLTYIGSLTLPFRDFSFVLTVYSREEGITGAREALVVVKLLDSGIIRLEVDSSGAPVIDSSGAPVLKGWLQDLYDSNFRAPMMRNLSESEEYDSQFPNHPLSRVRRLLIRVISTLEIAEEVKTAPPFVPRRGDAGQEAKRVFDKLKWAFGWRR